MQPLWSPDPRWQVYDMYGLNDQFTPSTVGEKRDTDSWGPRIMVINAPTKADAIEYAASVWKCDPSVLDANPV